MPDYGVSGFACQNYTFWSFKIVLYRLVIGKNLILSSTEKRLKWSSVFKSFNLKKNIFQQCEFWPKKNYFKHSQVRNPTSVTKFNTHGFRNTRKG